MYAKRGKIAGGIPNQYLNLTTYKQYAIQL